MNRKIVVFAAAAALLALGAPIGSAAQQQSAVGTWSGMLDVPGGRLLLVIAIARQGTGLAATLQSPYQSGVTQIPVDAINTGNGKLHFSIARIGASYDGTLENGAISGTFAQRGTRYPLVLLPSALGTSDLRGTWLGTLAVGDTRLLLALEVARAGDSSLTATLDSPFQHGYEIPASSVSGANGVLSFAIPSLDASYRGTLGLQSITGTFTQRGMSLPLTLARPGSDAAIPTPVPVPTPYPTAHPHFSSRTVAFASTGGAVLAGTLTIPNHGRARMPAFVFVHGSGPGTRNGGIPQNPTFLDLSNALSNAGIVVLRYDKRGIAGSTGTATEDWHVLGNDVRAAVSFLREQPTVDPKRIFLLGHSEGGIIVPLVAPSIRGLAGIVLMAPPAVPMERIIQEQSPRMTPALRRAVTRGLASYIGIDPGNVIRGVGAPILVLQGTRDIQVLPSDLPHLVAAARNAHRRITVDLLSGDDHLFLRVPDAAPSDGSEYETAAPLDPRVAADILRWLRGLAERGAS